VTSFFLSVQYASKLLPDTEHNIVIFDDHSTDGVVKYLKYLTEKFQSDKIKIEFRPLGLPGEGAGGLFNSIRTCYNWLEENGEDLVYQVQDDYLYCETAIYEMISLYVQFNTLSQYSLWFKDYQESADPIILAADYPNIWDDYKTFPTMVITGVHRKWLSMYLMYCTFLTSKKQFSRHWDLYELYFSLPPQGIPPNNEIESISIAKMLKERYVIGLLPFESVALHIQDYQHKDAFINWKEWWDKIPTYDLPK
jgi:hypothetical protein